MEDKIKFLLDNYGIDEQRTSAWFSKRGEMLTASEIWKCFGDATSSSRNELITSKLMPAKKQDGPGVGALIWGTRFESIAKEIYCHEEKVEVVELTCVQHPDHTFIGASPDGLIVSNGRLIELKCPISRSFDDTTPIPDHYYHQMQLQIECTGLEECDYIEMQFKTMNYSEWFESKSQYKSCFIVASDGKVTYKSIHNTQPIDEWKSEMMGTDFMNFNVVYWALLKKRQKLIYKDPDWFPQHLPEIKSTWDEILDHRKNGTFPTNNKEKSILAL
jgi:putative phage-type endonuclease